MQQSKEKERRHKSNEKKPQIALSIRLTVFINHYTPISCRRSTYGLTNQKTKNYSVSVSFIRFSIALERIHSIFKAHTPNIWIIKAREAIIWKVFSLLSVLQSNHDAVLYLGKLMITTWRSKRQKLWIFLIKKKKPKGWKRSSEKLVAFNQFVGINIMTVFLFCSDVSWLFFVPFIGIFSSFSPSGKKTIKTNEKIYQMLA